MCIWIDDCQNIHITSAVRFNRTVHVNSTDVHGKCLIFYLYLCCFIFYLRFHFICIDDFKVFLFLAKPFFQHLAVCIIVDNCLNFAAVKCCCLFCNGSILHGRNLASQFLIDICNCCLHIRTLQCVLHTKLIRCCIFQFFSRIRFLDRYHHFRDFRISATDIFNYICCLKNIIGSENQPNA